MEEVRGLLKNRRVLTQPQENDGREQDIDTLVIIVTVQYWEFWLVEFLLTLNSTYSDLYTKLYLSKNKFYKLKFLVTSVSFDFKKIKKKLLIECS